MGSKMADGSGFQDFERLRRSISGDVFDDSFNRGRYATDASIYQMMPHAVVIPKTADDIVACLAFARDTGTPLLPRGGGTSQCGQTVNHAIVLDTTKHLNKIIELDVKNRQCVVEPGIVLDELNRQLKPHGLWFPVDVSTSSRATIGGMTANNSCGAIYPLWDHARQCAGDRCMVGRWQSSQLWAFDPGAALPDGRLGEILPEPAGTWPR
ncbi:MAG: hypothetical protein CM15mP46_5730 [Alphaproteobacteria bacterium]|nr:MAG: hypothetical protein CM15mP46_5730 [Alphaproteobacteria bacterium]